MLLPPWSSFYAYLPTTACELYALLHCHLCDLFSREPAHQQPSSTLINQYAAHILHYIQSEFDLFSKDIVYITLLIVDTAGELSCKATYRS